MKKTTAGMIGVIVMVVGLASAAMAQSAGTLRAKIPFAFYAGKDLLEQGEYSFEFRGMTAFSSSTSNVIVRDRDGRIVHAIRTVPGSYKAGAGGDHLRFNRVGGRYFLAGVECQGSEAQLPKTTLEKELGIPRMAVKWAPRPATEE